LSPFVEIFNEKGDMPTIGVLHLTCKFRKVFSNKIVSYFLVSIQWLLIVLILAFDVRFSVAVPGGLSNGGLKVIMDLPVLLLFSSIVSCLLFVRLRNEGILERFIALLLVTTACLSIVNISLHFVNDLILMMKITEVVAWGSYNIMFALIAYGILHTYVVPMWRSAGSEAPERRNDIKARRPDQ
jgi:hypothetical protein